MPEEQLPLIDVEPENMEEIKAAAEEYRRIVKKRVSYSNKETDARNDLKALIKEADLKPLEDGTIRFKVDGLLVTMQPTDVKLTVKEDKTAAIEEE